MSTVIRYTGHTDGYIDFYMGEELISCEDSINQVTAQQLWDAIVEVEDEQLAMGFLGIGSADGKNPSINSALNVNLLRNWRINTEKINGAFKLIGGNVTSELLGTEPFEPNNLVFMTNQLSQFGTTITVASASTLLPDERAKLLSLPDADEVAVSVWDRLVQVAPVVGSYGEFVKEKLLTTFKFMGLK